MLRSTSARIYLPLKFLRHFSVSSSVNTSNHIVQELKWRGLWHNDTNNSDTTLIENEAKNLSGKEKIGVYCGFDPTADSLHIGNLLAIVTLIRFSNHGFKALALVGGATGKLGDPSGRTEARDSLHESVLEKNLKGITKDIHKIFANSEKMIEKTIDVEVVDNAKWYQDLNVISFLQDVGSKMPVTSMLRKDSIKKRLESEQGATFTEFAYQLFQSYDFLHLYRNHNCHYQIGGSDQFGNITSGCDLVRRTTADSVYGITLPLMVTSSGEKFGKSMGNAVWLNEEKTRPYELYQYFYNTEDADLEKCFSFFTFLSQKEIKTVLETHQKNPEARFGQKELAKQLTLLIHGGKNYEKALSETKVHFETDLNNLSLKELEHAFEAVPKFTTSKNQLESKNIISFIFENSDDVFKSKSEIRRMIKQNGLFMNNNRVTDADYQVTKEDAMQEKYILIKAGKKIRIVFELI